MGNQESNPDDELGIKNQDSHDLFSPQASPRQYAAFDVNQAAENRSAAYSAAPKILLGQTIQSYAYRIIDSTKYHKILHPLIDFIIYDPQKNNGKLLSEWITEGIISEIVRQCSQILEESFTSSADADVSDSI